MKTTITRRNGKRFHSNELTLSEFYNPPAPWIGNATEWGRSVRDHGEDQSWYGMDCATIAALPEKGWQEGATRAMELLDAPEIEQGATRLARRWNEDDGEELDAQRALDGLPCWRQAYRAPGGNAGRIVTLIAHAGGNAVLDADEIAWKAYAIVRYVDAMESAGFRVALDVQFCAKEAYGPTGWLCTVHVKAAEDAVDLSQIAAALSAGAFRYYGFSWESAVESEHEPGRGKDYDLRPDELGVMYLPAEVISERTAREWLARDDHKADEDAA